jgi:hypothetical protein
VRPQQPPNALRRQRYCAGVLGRLAGNVPRQRLPVRRGRPARRRCRGVATAYPVARHHGLHVRMLQVLREGLLPAVLRPPADEEPGGGWLGGWVGG